MTHGPRYHVKPRRQRQGRTDYRKRLKLLKSRKVRLVVRKSIKNTRVQFVEYHAEGDVVLAQAVSDELQKQYGWKQSTATTPAAYLTGFLAGTKAKQQKISDVVLDIGRYVPAKGSKLFAVVKGVLDAGVSCPHDDAMLPSEDRLMGKHLNAELSSAVEKVKQKVAGGK